MAGLINLRLLTDFFNKIVLILLQKSAMRRALRLARIS
jgi:hypothetical protein